MNQSSLLRHIITHDALNEGSVSQPEHVSFLKCTCMLSAQLRELLENKMDDPSPLGEISREEFMELFNSTVRFSKDVDSETLIARRMKMMRFIARFRTKVHAIDEVVNDRRKNSSAAEKARIREADKKYRPVKRLEDNGMKESTGDKIIDSLIKVFGSKEKALAHLKNLSERK